MTTARQPHVSLGHVAMFTADLDRARRFYEDVVGLRTLIVEHPQGAAHRRTAAMSDSAGESVVLLLFEVPGYQSGLPDDVVGRRGRLDHVSFRTATPREFQQVVDRLVAAGASSGRVVETGPSRSVLFIDPDGGHHHVQTVNPSWLPAPSSDVIDRAALERTLAIDLG